jgi:hypothetical protein
MVGLKAKRGLNFRNLIQVFQKWTGLLAAFYFVVFCFARSSESLLSSSSNSAIL